MLNWIKTDFGYAAATSHGVYQIERKGGRFVFYFDGRVQGGPRSLARCKADADSTHRYMSNRPMLYGRVLPPIRIANVETERSIADSVAGALGLKVESVQGDGSFILTD